MFYFNRDLLAQPYPFPNSLLVYVFRPLLLRALGVRFVIADGTLSDPSIERVMSEVGKTGATVNLYEIKGANLGQFSPTQVIWRPDYQAAVAALREQFDFENRVVLLGALARLIHGLHWNICGCGEAMVDWSGDVGGGGIGLCGHVGG
jgi:hypothetical protein